MEKISNYEDLLARFDFSDEEKLAIYEVISSYDCELNNWQEIADSYNDAVHENNVAQEELIHCIDILLIKRKFWMVTSILITLFCIFLLSLQLFSNEIFKFLKILF